MLITPLQDLLRRRVIPDAEIIQATGRDRVTLWRWRERKTYPYRCDARVLVTLFQDRGFELDMDGCYIDSVEVPDE